MQPGAHEPAEQPAPSDEDAPLLALERFAAMSADLEAGASRDEVLGREGLSVAAWTRAQESWLAKMADEAARKRFDLTNRYNAAFVAQRRTLDGSARRAGQKNKKKDPIAAPAKAAVAAPPVVAAPPSFAAAPAPFVAPPPSFAAAAAPSFVAAPAFVAMHAPPVVAAPAPVNLGGTVAAEVISPFASGAPLPFKQGRAVIAESRPSPPEATPRSRKGATLDGTSSSFAGRVIPFVTEAPPRAPEAPSVAEPSTAPMPPMDLGGTVVAGLTSPFASGAPLPFRATSKSNAAPAPPTASSLKDLPFRSTADLAPPAAPQPAAAPARATRFTLEQFASLSAEIAVAPPAVAQVRGRYGLDEASHRAEAEEWGRRFAADKELFVRYSALFQSYRDWLTRSGR